jgi:hypothetical protein
LFSHKESIDELIRVLSIKFGLDAGEIFRIVSDIHTIGKKTTKVKNILFVPSSRLGTIPNFGTSYKLD